MSDLRFHVLRKSVNRECVRVTARREVRGLPSADLPDPPQSNERVQTGMSEEAMPRVILTSLNLEAAERQLCVEALLFGGSIADAALLLGISLRSMIQNMVRLQIEWPAPCENAYCHNPG